MDPTSSPSAQATAVIYQLMPVGTIIAYGSSKTDSLPPGWLLCDGSQFDQTKYPDLYAALGNSSKVPDLRGYFLRGLDTAGHVDRDGSGRTVLSVQQDAFGKHHHTTDELPWFWSERSDGSDHICARPGQDPGNTGNGLHQQDSTDAGGAETRPINVAVHYLIFAGLPH